MHRSPTAALLLLLFFAAPASSSERIELAPRYQPGDAYVLSLSTATDTDVASEKAAPVSFQERVRVDYGATVVVLEVDAAGRSVRERHEGVHLRVRRPDGERDLFEAGTVYEVRRGADGETQLFEGDERLERRLESIVAEVLASRFEGTTGAALLDPGRPVELGDTWELDPALARAFLRDRGVHAVELGDAPPTARLERIAGVFGPELVVHYVIPVAWLREPLPAGVVAARAQAAFAGLVRLPMSGPGRPVGHLSYLTLEMHGAAIREPERTRTAPWRLGTSELSDERAVALGRRALDAERVASTHDPR